MRRRRTPVIIDTVGLGPLRGLVAEAPPHARDDEPGGISLRALAWGFGVSAVFWTGFAAMIWGRG